MSEKGNGKGNDFDTRERTDLPTFEEFEIVPLSLISRRKRSPSLDPSVSQERSDRFQAATLHNIPDRSLPTTAPGQEEFRIAPISFERQRSTFNPNLLLGQDELGIRPLVIRKVAFPTTSPTAKTKATDENPQTPNKAVSSPPPYILQKRSFEPETPPPPTLSFSEEPSPKVINRYLKTGHLVTVTPSPELSASQVELHTPTVTFASRVPLEDLFEAPELLRVPHSSGKGADLSYSFAIFPAIGGREVLESNFISMSGEGEETLKPLVFQALGDGLDSDEATHTAPNPSIERREPGHNLPLDEDDDETLVTSGFADDPDNEVPIIEDLTPSYGTSGLMGPSSKQSPHTSSSGTSDIWPPTFPTARHSSLPDTNTGEAAGSEGSLQRTPDHMKPNYNEKARVKPPWRDVDVPSTCNDTNYVPSVTNPEYEEPVVNPDDDTATKGNNAVVSFLGGPGETPQMEDEQEKKAQEFLEREAIKALDVVEKSPQDARLRSAAFQRDFAFETRNVIFVSNCSCSVDAND